MSFKYHHCVFTLHCGVYRTFVITGQRESTKSQDIPTKYSAVLLYLTLRYKNMLNLKFNMTKSSTPYIPAAGETIKTINLSDNAIVQLNKRGIQIIDIPLSTLNDEGLICPLGLNVTLASHLDAVREIELVNGEIEVNIISD